MQIREIIDLYIEHAKSYYDTREPANLSSGLRRFFSDQLDLELGELRAPIIAKLRDDHARAGELARSTINKHLGYVGRMLRWAAEYGHADPTVVAQIQVVGAVQRGRHSVRESQQVQAVEAGLVELVRDQLPPQLRNYVDMVRATGMRPGEARTMRSSELELVGVRAYVYTPGQHKNKHRGQSRYIAIIGEAFDLTNRIIGQMRQRALYQDAEFLFSPGGDGRRPYAECSIPQAIRRAARKLGQETWSPNQLRHLYATDHHAQGHDIEDIATVLGHASTRTTRVYIHTQKQRAIEAARRLAS